MGYEMEKSWEKRLRAQDSAHICAQVLRVPEAAASKGTPEMRWKRIELRSIMLRRQ